MHKVPKTIHQQHCPNRKVVALVALEVLGVLAVLAWAAMVVEQGRCSHKIVQGSWAVTRHNLSGTNRQ